MAFRCPEREVGDARLIHDPVIDALEPVIEPTQVLGGHIDLSGRGVKPRTHEEFGAVGIVAIPEQRVACEAVEPSTDVIGRNM